MARVWMINPFDPLPGAEEQSGRYASLARLLRDAGHQVTWWTASFSHRFKRELDRAAIEASSRREQIEVRILPVRAYQKNVSLRRIRSHGDFVRELARQAPREPAARVIIASNPLAQAAVAAGRLARQTGAALIVDVQDTWVTNFRGLLPAPLRWAWPLLLRSWIRADRDAYAAADAVVGVARRYADEPRRYGVTDCRTLVVPLGAPLEEVDAAARAGRCLLGPKPADEIWVLYSGSFSISYDVLTLSRLGREFQGRGVRFIFSGRGELEPQIRREVSDLANVTWLGFASFPDWAATMAQCDIGCNAIHESANIFFPNKIFFYWSAGLAILNSLPGECADWVAKTASGVTYRAGDMASASATLESLIADRSRLAAMRAASRHAAEETWDRRRLYIPYVQLVNELAAGQGRSAPNR